MNELPFEPAYFINKMRRLHLNLRDHLRGLLHSQDLQLLSEAAPPRDGDTIYHIDEKGESLLFEYCQEWSKEVPFILTAEGIAEDGKRAYPEGSNPNDAQFIMIIDPIDGTRPLMYDKRSAWILSGIAPNRGDGTTLLDISVAMQTEIPTTRQYLAYHLWASEGSGANAELHDVIHQTAMPTVLTPSKSKTIEHGFAEFVKFFPAGKRQTVDFESRIFERVLGELETPTPLVFDDQYISTGGQLYELMCGHDRFVGDLRPLLTYKSAVPPLCAHPYDICTELIAREAGVIITGADGQRLNCSLDIRENVAWLGYANESIRQSLEPIIMSEVHSLTG